MLRPEISESTDLGPGTGAAAAGAKSNCARAQTARYGLSGQCGVVRQRPIAVNKPKIVVLSPALHAVSGVSTHVRILFSSELAQNYELLHFQVGSEGRKEIGRAHV
jgi:hypothetical protein